MFILEGNIGAGKSTFLQLIAKHAPYFTVLFEPVKKWQEETYGTSLLRNFYDDTSRWAYSFETMAMMSRVREHILEQQHINQFRITERSIYSGHYVFSKNCYESGYMTSMEWHMYLKWFDFLIAGRCTPPSGFIYLYTAPEVAYERVLKRSRYDECNISKDYLSAIHDKHEEFLRHRVAADLLPELKEVPVLILDCNEEFEENDQKLHEHLEAVQNFVNLHVPGIPIMDTSLASTQFRLI